MTGWCVIQKLNHLLKESKVEEEEVVIVIDKRAM